MMSDVSQSLCELELFTVSFCAHLFSHSVKLLTALLIGSCGRLSQIICNASLSSVIDLGFGHRAPNMLIDGSGESGGH